VVAEKPARCFASSYRSRAACADALPRIETTAALNRPGRNRVDKKRLRVGRDGFASAVACECCRGFVHKRRKLLPVHVELRHFGKYSGMRIFSKISGFIKSAKMSETLQFAHMLSLLVRSSALLQSLYRASAVSNGPLAGIDLERLEFPKNFNLKVDHVGKKSRLNLC
jgi:hypothetical protein